MRKRRLWKTFYVPGGDDFNSLSAVWQSWDHDGHVMDFQQGIGAIETNLPLRELRDIFRLADVPWCDYVSDTKPSWDESVA